VRYNVKRNANQKCGKYYAGYAGDEFVELRGAGLTTNQYTMKGRGALNLSFRSEKGVSKTHST